MHSTRKLVLTPRGPFSLDAIRDFQCGLMMASRSCSAAGDEVRLVFPLDGTHAPVGVKLAVRAGVVEVEVYGEGELETVGRQVARILSLDHDAGPYARLLAADPVLRAAGERRPGFRPPIFFSPYAAAGWLVLAQRLGPPQAARLQESIARAAGDVVEIDGEAIASFPRPQTLLGREGFAGVSDEKWRRLQTVARAALDGELEVERLTSVPWQEARAALERLRGIGAWTAEGVLMRGCGLRDALTLAEPRVHAAVQLAYGLASVPSDEELAARAESWRPYRAWVSVLLTAEYHRRVVDAGRREASMRRRG